LIPGLVPSEDPKKPVMCVLESRIVLKQECIARRLSGKVIPKARDGGRWILILPSSRLVIISILFRIRTVKTREPIFCTKGFPQMVVCLNALSTKNWVSLMSYFIVEVMSD